MLEPWQWTLGWLGAFFVGLNKGGLPGIGSLTIAIYASCFPARDSVGILLVVLISADLVAVTIYRRHAEWKWIVRLLPWTFGGILVGYFFLGRTTDDEIRILIACLLLGMTGIHFMRKVRLRRKDPDTPDRFPASRWFAALLGSVGGFATMIANAAGPVGSLYLMAAGLPKLAFIGTAAWFYFILNLVKLPLHTSLGLVNLESAAISLSLAPAAALGAVMAPLVVRLINQRVFEILVWSFVVASGLQLLF